MTFRPALLTAVAVLSGCAALSSHDHGTAASDDTRDAMRMKMMEDTHARMKAARTPAERAAVMHEHMKAMHQSMGMSCEMPKPLS